MYVELDVYYALTRGWRWDDVEENIAFTFQRGHRLAIVRDARDPPVDVVDAMADDGSSQGEDPTGVRNSGAPTIRTLPLVRELPIWALHRVVPQVPSSELSRGSILRRVGALLTRGVKARTVVWPVKPTTVVVAGPAESHDGRDEDSCSAHGTMRKTSSATLSELSCNATHLIGARGEKIGCQQYPAGPKQRADVTETDPLVDLRNTHRGEVEMIELTFSSTQEARARAVLLALATKEPGVRSNRPVAQLMTYEMLRRAAAGEKGQAVPTLEAPAQGFRRGDDVEVSVLRLSEGCSGAWFPGIVDRRNGYGSTYKVRVASRTSRVWHAGEHSVNTT